MLSDASFSVIAHFALFGLILSLSTSANYSQTDNSTVDFDDARLTKWKASLAEIIGSPADDAACVCDQTLNSCDVDCCCDPDCAQIDKYAFSRCSPSPIKSRTDFCSSTQNIFDRKRFGPPQANRALCLWRDNARQRLLFAKRKLITDSSKLSSIKPMHYYEWAGNNHSNWIRGSIDSRNGTVYSVKSSLEYKSSSSIIRTISDVTTGLFDHWTLPSSINSLQQECNHLRTVNYMRPFRSDCKLSLRPLSRVCTQNKHLNVHTYHQSIRFHYYDMLKDEHRLVGVELGANYSNVHFDPRTGTCHNVVAKVKYTVWHRGIYGITRVLLQVHQIDVPSSISSLKLSQKFAVDFEWAPAHPLNHTPPALSGTNLGYIFNRSLLFAEQTVNKSFVAIEKQLISNYRLGICLLHHEIAHNVIRFGINQFTQCRLRLTFNTTKAQICSELGRHISPYYDQGPSGLYVATLGNTSRVANSSDLWLQVLELQLPLSSPSSEWSDKTCGNLSGGGSLKIYYAKEGSEAGAQHRIVGAVFRRRPLRGVSADCAGDRCRLTIDTDLVYSVDFIDVTEPLRPDYAPAPSIKIELPSDIFYPFQTSSATTTPSTIIIYLLLVISHFPLILVMKIGR